MDPQKQASAYFLDYNIVIPALPASKIEWDYGLNDFGDDYVDICPVTLRPFYYVKEGTWEDAAFKKFNVKSKNLYKGYKYFMGFVQKHEKLPTVDELITFYFNRYIEAGKSSTLPFLAQRWTIDVIEVYRPHFEKLEIKSIIEIFNKYNPIDQRCAAEK